MSSPQQHPVEAIPAWFESENMHANLRIGNAMLMLSDGNSNVQPG